MVSESPTPLPASAGPGRHEAIEFTIEPPKAWLSIDWREIWRFRDLFLVLAWRDISVRYKQTVLGALWAIFQPLMRMVIFTFIFNRLAHIDSGDGTPYPIFLYVGLLLWQYYSSTLSNASSSMVSNASIIQKVYFPRLIIPATAATTGLVDLAVASLILVGMMVYYGYRPQWLGLALLPLLLVGIILAGLGLGLFMAALNIKYRDVRYALPFLIETLMYVTPVIYPVSLLEGRPWAQTLMLWLNPVSGIISTARVAFLGRGAVSWPVLGISLLMSAIYFAAGLYYFRHTERYFADIV